MANLAAILPAPKAPLEIHEVELYTPGPHELLIRNKVITPNPVEFKIQLGFLPVDYPAIIGSTFGGIVEAVGTDVKKFAVGDRVVASKKFGIPGNQYGAYQRFVVVQDDGFVVKVKEETLAPTASVLMNLTCVVGLFSGRLGYKRPSLDKSTKPEKQSQKVLIYGGSSSFGGLAVEYLSQAGYEVVTTSSPKHTNFVAKLGADKVMDHTLEPDTLRQELIASGPYDVVVDMITLPGTIPVTAGVVKAQGGSKLYIMQPIMDPSSVPEGVEPVFEPWSSPLYEEKNTELLRWTLETLISRGIPEGFVTAIPTEKLPGGLKGLNEGLQKMQKGMSGLKLVADPWE